ncbi:glycosyltransferase family 87 protein [Afipia sp. TerB]
MSLLVQRLRTGEWLTPARIRGYSLILLAITVLAIVGWIALSDGLTDRNGKPIGTDFSNVYAAGTLGWAGKAADAYVPALQHAAEKAVFGDNTPFFGWHYPPFFFVIAFAVAALPYAFGLLAWMAAGLAAYLATIRAILPRKETWLVALAFPAVFVNLGHGQNGFLTAALLGGALQMMDRRPWLAGVLIGLLAYKPQFGVLIPLALLASQRWTTIAAAAATVSGLVLAATLSLGTGIWQAFLNSTGFTQHIVLEQGGTGWEKIQSAFSAVSAWGASVPVAYAVQTALGLALAVSIVWLWRSDAAFDLKASALATASLLATPYVLDYDLMVLAIAIAFFVRHGLTRGFGDWEISLLAFAWIAPLVSRGIAAATTVPLGLIAMLALYAVTIRRAALDLREGARQQATPANPLTAV